MPIAAEPTLITSDGSVLGIYNSTATSLITEMDFIPQQLQLPVVIVIALLGFLAVLGLSKLSTRGDSKGVEFANTSETTAPATPVKTPVKTRSTSGTPIEQKTGTVMTPAGRRSARIARTRRKED